MSKKYNKFKSKSDLIIKSYEDPEFYKNHFISNVLSKHINDQKKIDQLQISIIDFLKFVTDTLSVMYNDQVIRTINSEDKKLNDLLTEVSTAYDKVSPNIDKYTFISGMTAVKAHYDDIDNEFEYVLYTNNMIDYTPRPDDFSKMDELYLEFYYDTNRAEESWTTTEYNNNVGGINVTTENPYGIIPFSIYRNKEIPNSWFCPPKSGLLDIQDYLSNQLTQFGNTFKFQSMSMLVVKGGGDLKSLNYGASAMNQIAEEDDMQFITPDVDMDKLMIVINEQLTLFSRMNNIPDSLISAKSTQSGVSIIVSQRMLDEYIKERSKSFVDSEATAIKQGMIVLGYHRGIKIPNDLKVSVNHISANSITKLTKEEMDLWEFYFKNNIYTTIDLMKKMNPNLTDEEAETKIKENEKRNTILNVEQNNEENEIVD